MTEIAVGQLRLWKEGAGSPLMGEYFIIYEIILYDDSNVAKYDIELREQTLRDYRVRTKLLVKQPNVKEHWVNSGWFVERFSEEVACHG